MESETRYRARHAPACARLLESIAVDQCDVGADIGVFRHVPLEAVANLDLEILSCDVIHKLLGLRVIRDQRSPPP